jgi:DHA3 family tetracycline resistance protein-like MFS transporter
MLRKWDAYNTFLLMRVLATFGFSVTFGVNMVYQVAMVGLNPLQLVLVGTTLELAAFVFEIPTGILADLYSRRLSVIIGYCLIGIGFWVEAIPTFAMVLLAQLIWGFGYTFISGASDAWIVDEIGNERANKAFVIASKWSQIAGFLGLWVSILLGLIRLNMPHLVGGGSLIVLSAILIVIMPEEGFQRVPAEERESWRDLFKVFGEGVKLMRLRPILIMIVGSSLLIGLFSEGWDRLHTAHLLLNFALPDANSSYETLLLFGVIATVGSILGFVGTSWLERKNWQTHEQLSTGLMWMYGIVGLGVLLFAWSTNLIMVLTALWLMDLARTLSQPLFMSWINNHIDSKVRATVLSVASQANAIGQIAGGPPVGYLGILTSLRIALSVSGLLMLPAVLLVTQIRAKGRESVEVVTI